MTAKSPELQDAMSLAYVGMQNLVLGLHLAQVEALKRGDTIPEVDNPQFVIVYDNGYSITQQLEGVNRLHVLIEVPADDIIAANRQAAE